LSFIKMWKLTTDPFCTTQQGMVVVHRTHIVYYVLHSGSTYQTK
jgi:hypothetical protein